MAPWQ